MKDKLTFQDETNITIRRRIAAEKLLIGFKTSAFLAYCSPFSYEIRQELLYNQWKNNLYDKNILLTKNFQIENFLSTNIEISEWISQGLPADEFSIQNGILTLQTNRFPFCIDPQLQALLWIKNREKKFF
ncbi:unnamed protein product [Rotaria sp. Silwood2]|nr:unnamed protein product [Rotaria sp. Silwood2]